MKSIADSYYQKASWLKFLRPIGGVYGLISWLRKKAYQLGLLKSYAFPVPVIVVGNITLGGTGKTPLTLALIEHLQAQGYKPGVVSRGYGGQAPHYPFAVSQDSSPKHSGDEPLLIAKRSQCPVVIDPKRPQAVKHLLQNFECNVIISDDGLQHYALQRDMEIVVIDGVRRFGNEYLFPAGPLREPLSRLNEVDFVISNGVSQRYEYQMQLAGDELVNLHECKTMPLTELVHQKVHAIAGIGNPQRFFEALRKVELDVIEHAFDDHHAYSARDIVFNDDYPVIMTEKDAVKCVDFASSQHWYLPVKAQVEERFWQAFDEKFSRLT